MSHEVESMDAMRAEFEKWHTEHFIEPLTRSKGGSDYRDSNVVRRWEGWQGARNNRPEVKDTRCYAPSCGHWDGNSECTCQREKVLHFSD